MSDLPPLPESESYPEQLRAVIADARSRLCRHLMATSLESLDTLAGAARALTQRTPDFDAEPRPEDPNGNLLAAAAMELCSTGSQILKHYKEALSAVITPDDPALDAIRGTTPDSAAYILRDLMRDYKALMEPSTDTLASLPAPLPAPPGDLPRYGEEPTLELICTLEAVRRAVNAQTYVWLVGIHAGDDTVALSMSDTKMILAWASIATRPMAIADRRETPLLVDRRPEDRDIKFGPTEAWFNITFEGEPCVVRIPRPELHQPLVLNIRGSGFPRRIRVPREDIVRVVEEVAAHMGVL